MTIPTQYSIQNESVIIDKESQLLTIDYSVQEKRGFFGLRNKGYVASLSILNHDTSMSAFEYEIPKDLKIREELSEVENGLYAVIDETLRSLEQYTATQAAKKTIAYHEEGLSSSLEMRLAETNDTGKSITSNDLITAIVGTTNITSLTQKGFLQYREESERSLKGAIAEADSASGDTLHAVILYLDAKRYKSAKTAKKGIQRFLDNLENAEELSLTKQQRSIIVNNFVPEYHALQRSTRAPKYPEDVFDHALESAIGGGLGGYIGGLIAEALIFTVTKTHVKIPGFYIGAGLQFARPYVSETLRYAKGKYQLENKERKLIERIERQLYRLPSAERKLLKSTTE